MSNRVLKKSIRLLKKAQQPAKLKVAILIGSDSDLPETEEGAAVLEKLKIPYELRILSAHRTPKAVTLFAEHASARGFGVIISGAGMAAHLSGVIAAHTLLPVIGVPLSGKLDGLDSLLSTVQMPRGVPVATVTLGRSGFVNAALLAAQILALQDRLLHRRLKEYRKKMSQEVLKKDKILSRQIPRPPHVP